MSGRHDHLVGRETEHYGTIGAQRLRAAVTLFDAFVRDDVVKTYRVLGTVVED
jgi:hypothetical protein